jgi:hypothetical protein
MLDVGRGGIFYEVYLSATGSSQKIQHSEAQRVKENTAISRSFCPCLGWLGWVTRNQAFSCRLTYIHPNLNH